MKHLFKFIVYIIFLCIIFERTMSTISPLFVCILLQKSVTTIGTFEIDDRRENVEKTTRVGTQISDKLTHEPSVCRECEEMYVDTRYCVRLPDILAKCRFDSVLMRVFCSYLGIGTYNR